jgi:hypothetical protein
LLAEAFSLLAEILFPTREEPLTLPMHWQPVTQTLNLSLKMVNCLSYLQ